MVEDKIRLMRELTKFYLIRKEVKGSTEEIDNLIKDLEKQLKDKLERKE